MLSLPKVASKRDFLAEEVGRLFFNFLNSFLKKESLYFFEQIETMIFTGSNTLYVNFEDLIQFSDELADIIEEQFVRVDSFLCDSILEFLKKNFYKVHNTHNSFNLRFSIGFFNFPNLRAIKSLGCLNIGKLISITGIVIRVTEPQLELSQGTFECTNENCKFRIKKVEQKYVYSEPKFCPSCGNTNSWTLNLKKSIFTEIQKIRIQEIPEICQNKIIPQTLDVFIEEENIGKMKPGSKCIFTGLTTIFPLEQFFFSRENQTFPMVQDFFPNSNSKKDFEFKPFFSTKFRASHVFYLDRALEKSQNDGERKRFFSKEERELILKIRSQPNLFEFLKLNFLPKFLQENVRLSILLMLLGGSYKKTQEPKKFHENLNVCLVGTSLIEKNFFIRSLSLFSPRIININGQISFGSSITASIAKESGTNKFFIEAGALLLGRNGICCIEEFDKLKKDDQLSIFKVMENQRISVGEDESNLTIKTDVSILASIEFHKNNHNEGLGLRNKKKTKNSFLNKFDLVFFLNFDENENETLEYSKNLFGFFQKNIKNRYAFTKSSIFQLYISFARLLNPVIPDENRFLLICIYKYLREFPLIDRVEGVFINIKQLESLVKLSEAFAKLFLCLKVSKIHIKAAARLLFSSLPSSNFSSRKFFKNLNEIFVSRKTKEKKKTPPKYPKAEIRISFNQFRKAEEKIFKMIKQNESRGFIGISFKNLYKNLLREKVGGSKFEKIFNKNFLLMFSLRYLLARKRLFLVPVKISEEVTGYPKILICLSI